MSQFILVVEDDDEIRESMLDVLRDEGFVCEGVTNGLEAIGFLDANSQKPALIFLDMMMPLMDGFQFRVRQLQQPELASIPTVFISAGRDLEAKAEKAGLTEFLKKPVELDSLLQMAFKYCKAPAST